MAKLTNNILDNVKDGTETVVRETLDTLYGSNAIIFQDMDILTKSMVGGGFVTAAIMAANKLLGFVYEQPNSLEILKYNYAEYPYLNKSVIVNSYQKETTRFSIRSYRAISRVNNVITNIALNEALYYLLSSYCDRGGRFIVMTMWGTFNNMVLESLSIIPPKGNEVGGVGLLWNMRKLNILSSYSTLDLGGDTKTLDSGLAIPSDVPGGLF